MSQGSEPAACACGTPAASARTVTSAESAARAAVLSLENVAVLILENKVEPPSRPTCRTLFDRNAEPISAIEMPNNCGWGYRHRNCKGELPTQTRLLGRSGR